MEFKSASKLESTVKTLLVERSLSMRQLAKSTGINVSTISKMISGKQRINPDYLQRITHHLFVPVDTLFAAAGFDVGSSSTLPSEDPSVETLETLYCKQVLRLSNSIKGRLNRNVRRYELYAKTSEGRKVIIAQFPVKREQISATGTFVNEMDTLFHRFTQPDITNEEQAVIGSGLLYFILATDVIPDFVFPIGYLDDAVALQLIRDRLAHFASHS
ncbi:helix-turn-helix domain-containing protein [Alicyclobacillus fastidiosus]|uniref:Helix-turn-helix domain-containing protein n=1 Tax=Alicyclobacillus fastidiosus TaxID=392011 RepID=A0ABY6ZMD0_9BACL|nr:helix-turn-helix domain-containing protein [Alicyclobacillus fastidiosus]WAH44044.1 helix-turn-helix domain-containing protein [Alicyclobacillus fastidiosus]